MHCRGLRVCGMGVAAEDVRRAVGALEGGTSLRGGVLIWMGLAALAAAGCSDRRSCPCERAWVCESPVAGARAELAAALLFDAQPGDYTASDFAVRSDWPSTTAFYSPGQVIFFSERFVDYQRPGAGESDWTYRRFETVRSGFGYR